MRKNIDIFNGVSESWADVMNAKISRTFVTLNKITIIRFDVSKDGMNCN